MSKLRGGIGVLWLMCLQGCFWTTPTVPVNLNFVESAYGYLNAGDYRAGSLFRWDRSPQVGRERLEFIGYLTGFDIPPRDRLKAEDYADYARGAAFEIGADLGVDEGAIDTEISRRARFKLTNFRREKSDAFITRLSHYIKMKPATPSEPARLRTQPEKDAIMEAWRFRDVVNDRDQYFVLVTDVTYGDEVFLEIDNAIKTGASFTVPVLAGKVRVDLVGRDLRKLSGNFTELMFRVDILAPYWNTRDGEQFPDFKVVTGGVFPDMPRLLREIDTPTPGLNPQDPE